MSLCQGGVRQGTQDWVHLMLTVGELCQALAMVRDDGSDELYWNCKPNFTKSFDSIELQGERVVSHGRGFLRPSNLIISCDTENQYRWQLYYFNHQSGTVLDPSTYLKMTLNSPRDVSLPILTLSSLQKLASSKGVCDIALMEFDFLTMARGSTQYSRALQFALRHRLLRMLSTKSRAS